MAKVIEYKNGQAGMIAGLNKVVDAVKVTLGPKGKCVAIQSNFGTPEITRDGATVAKAIELKDPNENMGAQLVKEAARKTEDMAGDGPQPLTAKVLTPDGWTTMGNLKVGDKICGTNGTIQEVTGIFMKGEKELYKVHFEKGQVVECCADHLWTVSKDGKNFETIPLKLIIKEENKLYTPKSGVENHDELEKMDRIEHTTGKVEMMCIKVSNPDELYITNDYIVTHNTSGTSVLIQELVKRGQNYNAHDANMNEIKSGMDKAVAWVTEYIKANSIPVDGDLEKIRRVATISANNDSTVGDLIVQCMEKVGADGVIVADKSSGLETTIDVVEGFKIERGWASPHFVTTPADGLCTMENPVILVTGEKISSVPQILKVIESAMKSGQPLLIVCDDIDEVVMTTLVVNVLQGAIRCCVVKGIDFGDSRKNIMQDIASAVGATFVCPEHNIKLSDASFENLGAARKVVVSKDSCIIYEGAGDEEEVHQRVEVLKAMSEGNTISDYEKTKVMKRISCLSGGIGIIKAGGASDMEKDNRKATIEDAILASKSAIAEGVVPGGGYVFLKASKDGYRDFIEKNRRELTADEQLGAEIVLDSLRSIVWTIGENSGIQGDVLIEKLSKNFKDKAFGYNSKTNKFGDLVEMGILDSAKVLRVSLENAVSAASMCLLTCCTITPEEEEKPEKINL